MPEGGTELRMYIVPWIFRIVLAVFLLGAAGALMLTVMGVDLGLFRPRDGGCLRLTVSPLY